MLLHNLKIAWRNILKYKVQNTISILSLAVGMVVILAVHAVLEHFSLPAIFNQPHFDRSYRVEVIDDKEVSDSQETFWIDAAVHQAIVADGGLRDVERLVVANGQLWHTKARFSPGTKEEKVLDMSCVAVDGGYLNFRGYRSALTGDVIPILKPGEAVITEFQAHKVFGDRNPVGVEVQGRYAESYIIRDVMASTSMLDFYSNDHAIYHAVDVNREIGTRDDLDIPRYEAVLCKGSSVKQLEREINRRLKPLGKHCYICSVRDIEYEKVRQVLLIKSVAYIIGSLILLAALIGYLKMQIQLFWMRKREAALRIVNGAKPMDIFVLMMTETLLMMVASVTLAMALSQILKNYVFQHLAPFLEDLGWEAGDTLGICLMVGAVVLAISAVVVGTAIRRICHSSQGLAANMRNGRTHTFRNVMLGVQMVISLFFLCATFGLKSVFGVAIKTNITPDQLKKFKQTLYVSDASTDVTGRLYEELISMPETETVIPFYQTHMPIEEIIENEGVRKFFGNGYYYYNTYLLCDTALFSFYSMPIHWLRNDFDHQDYLLLHEHFYHELDSLGLIQGGTLRILQGAPMPIAGTFQTVLPYEYDLNDNLNYYRCVACVTHDKKMGTLIVVPRPGQYNSLKHKTEEAYRKIDPKEVETKVHNLHEHLGLNMNFIEIMQTGAWILSAVCLLTCIMSIYSTISLDTRARRKEMALRKIHGAKSWHIMRIFARLYVWLSVVSMAVCFPLVIFFIRIVLMEGLLEDHSDRFSQLSFSIPILSGSVVMFTLILLIVGWHIRHIMNVNPVKYIAKE